MSEHTPTPWRLDGYDIKSAAHESRHIVASSDCFWGLNRDKANAAFIVRACNAHDTLLAAAEKVLAGLNAMIDAADGSAAPVFHGIAELHSAINLAKGAK